MVGNILHTVPEVSLTFKTLNEEYLYIPLTDIQEIKHEKYQSSNGKLIPNPPADSLNTGIRYWFWLQGGGRLDLGDTKALRPQIDMIHGVRKQRKFRLGVGIGARFFGEDELFLVPAYLYIQTAHYKGRLAPMVAIGAGIVSNPKFDWIIGKPFLRGDIGIQYAIESGGFFTLTVGFEQMNFYEVKDRFHTKFNTINYLTLNLGIML